MIDYYVMNGADKEKPGSGFVEKQFEAEDDQEAMTLVRRHYEGSGYTVWADNGVNRNAHIQFRYVGNIDKEKQSGSGATAG